MKKVVSIYLDEEVIDAIKELANKDSRSVSSMIEVLLKKQIGDKDVK